MFSDENSADKAHVPAGARMVKRDGVRALDGLVSETTEDVSRDRRAQSGPWSVRRQPLLVLGVGLGSQAIVDVRSRGHREHDILAFLAIGLGNPQQ
jgi:hypothetical protein